MRWGTTNLYIAVAGAVLGTTAVGAIRTAQLILGMCNILIFGMENFALVRAAQNFGEGGTAALLRYLERIAVFGGLVIGGIALVAAVTPEFWLGLIKEEYQGYGYLVRWWALFSFISFARMPIEFGLRTIERTRTMFWAHFVGALFSVVTVYPLINNFGLTGVMAGIGLIIFIRILLLLYGFQRQLLLHLRETAL
jgi:O-antigen/teichoic acid export membrane protein